MSSEYTSHLVHHLPQRRSTRQMLASSLSMLLPVQPPSMCFIYSSSFATITSLPIHIRDKTAQIMNHRWPATASCPVSIGKDRSFGAHCNCPLPPFFHTIRTRSAHELFIRYVQNEMGNSPALLYAESFICPRQVRSKPYQALNMAEVSMVYLGRWREGCFE